MHKVTVNVAPSLIQPSTLMLQWKIAWMVSGVRFNSANKKKQTELLQCEIAPKHDINLTKNMCRTHIKRKKTFIKMCSNL